MSRENVRLSNQSVAAFNRRDLDAFLEFCHPEIEFISRLRESEGGGPYHGREGIRSWWQDLLSVAPDFEAEVEEVRDLGDVTVTRQRNRGRAFASGAPMEQAIWHVVEWRNSKAIWWRACPSEAAALEAVGLSEQDAHPAD
jgi:ketosteroid isomerase-like protein